MKRKFSFPRKEPRFAPWLFSLSWEQRKLGELCDVFRSGEFIKASDIYEDGAFPVYGGNGLRGHADRFNYDGNYALIGRQGALCGNMNFSSGKAYFTEHAVAVHANDNNNTRFLFYLLDTMNLGQYSAQSAQPGLAVNKLITLPALCPSKLEQETIAEFLTRIDTLITLHQRGANSWGRVRFRRFCSATIFWEQRKLGEITEEVTRNDPSSDAPIMMITANNGFIEQSERYAFNNAGESLKKYILLKKGELAYNHGASKLRPFGSCFALRTVDNARIPFVYHCFSSGEHNPEFLSIQLNGQRVENQLRKIVSSGARMDGLLNISYEEYSSLSILLPCSEEQHQIADYFRQIDDLITLHQCKLRMLSKLRKMQILHENALLRWRLTTAWEQRKLGDITSSYSGGTPTVGNKEFYDGKIPFIRSGEIHSSTTELFINDKALDSSSAKMVRAGDILYALYGATSGEVSRSQIDGAINQAILAIIPDSEHDSDYLVEWLRKEKQNIITTYLQGGQGNLSAQIVKELLIPIATPEEQQKIGRIFREINDLITLHQREFTHTNSNTNYVKYYQRNRPLLCVLRSMDKSV